MQPFHFLSFAYCDVVSPSKRAIRAALLVTIVIGIAACLADDVRAQKKLVVGISPDTPPYVMQNATKGLEVDIVRRALKGYQLRFVQMPYHELEKAIQQNKADVALVVQLAEKGVFYSKDFITFSNVAVSKKAAGLKINSVVDLKNHTVLTWENAYLDLGDEFKRLFSPKSPQRKNYVEFADQGEQVRKFWQGKDKVAVIDRNIFRYYTKKMGHSLDDVVFHSIFPPATTFRAGFKNEAVRDTFNRRLAELCASREYQKLLEKYHVSLVDNVCDEEEVRKATKQFYVALNAIFKGDLGPMEKVWSHSDSVTYMGPFGGIQVGWDKVRENWKTQADRKLGGQVKAKEIHIIVGRDIAVVKNYEKGKNTNLEGKVAGVSIRATTIFGKEGGQWKVIGHHTDLLPIEK